MREEWIDQGDKIVRKKTHDLDHAFDEVRLRREAPWVVTEWLKEAGVAWDDPAAKDVLRKKLMSGDVGKFRVHGGTF
ncbi:MAG: hypothetical protein IPJ52_12615 [Rhodocyclaceae bacterium]|nr:hypothetical protein [Rhodocyclaceae bacterium]